MTLATIVLVALVAITSIVILRYSGFNFSSAILVVMLPMVVVVMVNYHRMFPILIIAFLVPLTMPFIATRGLTITELLFSMLVGFYVLQRMVHRSDYNRVRLYTIPPSIYLFFVIGLISFIASGDILPQNLFGRFEQAGSFRAYFTFFTLIFGYFLVLSLFKEEKHIRQAMKVLFWLSLIATFYFYCLIALYPMPISQGLVPYLQKWSVKYFGGGRFPVRSIGMANIGLLLFCVTIAGEYPRRAWLKFPILGLAATTVVLAGGRAVFAGLLVAVLAYLYFKRYYLFLTGATVLAVLMVSIPLMFPRSVEALPEPVQRVVQFEREDDTLAGRSLAARFKLWQYSLEDAIEKPLTGMGFRQFDINLLIYGRLRGVSAFVEMSRLTGSTHNGYLAMAQVFGIPGLILFLTIFINHFRRTWKMYYKHTDPHVCKLSLFIMLVLISRSVILCAGGGPKEVTFFLYLGLAQGLWVLVRKNQRPSGPTRELETVRTERRVPPTSAMGA